jgi:predicted nucleotidyltransferase
MTLTDELKAEIVAKLKSIDPEKVILFGSHAWGTPTEDSDIDLYVVTKDDFMPATWSEKSAIHLRVARSIQDILRRYPTDLIVHTRPMQHKFMELKSSFSRDINSKGQKLYESN